jgi:hypothetical protein
MVVKRFRFHDSSRAYRVRSNRRCSRRRAMDAPSLASLVSPRDYLIRRLTLYVRLQGQLSHEHSLLLSRSCCRWRCRLRLPRLCRRASLLQMFVRPWGQQSPLGDLVTTACDWRVTPLGWLWAGWHSRLGSPAKPSRGLDGTPYCGGELRDSPAT